MGSPGDGQDIPFNTFTVKKPLTATLAANTRITAAHRPAEEDCRHLVIRAPGLAYLPGQSIGILPPGTDPRNGRPQALRLYSIASPSAGDDGKGDTVSLTVVRHYWKDEAGKPQPGVCSHYLIDLPVGSPVTVTGPVGKRFLLPTDYRQRDILFLATGTGIAPFRAFLMKMFAEGYAGQCHLVFGARYQDTLLYDDYFTKLAATHRNFHYHTALSREGPKNPVPQELPSARDAMYVYVRLYLERAKLAASLAKPDTLIYVCGIKGMEEGIETAIDRIGVEQGLGEHLFHRLHKDEGRALLEVY